MQSLKILHCSVDEMDSPSYFHILIDEKHFKYLSIEPGTYALEDLTFFSILIPQLPPLPPGEWNLGHITNSAEGIPHFDWTSQKSFSSIQNLWHSTIIDSLSLTFGRMLLPNVYEATAPGFPAPVIVKFARFPWEVAPYDRETEAYSWLQGSGIGAKFLGHLKEGDRTVGFVLEKVEGRHAGPGDLEICREEVEKLHGMGIRHGDLNRFNFLVKDGDGNKKVVLLDFECARKEIDEKVLKEEIEGLEGLLKSSSMRGGRSM